MSNQFKVGDFVRLKDRRNPIINIGEGSLTGFTSGYRDIVFGKVVKVDGDIVHFKNQYDKKFYQEPYVSFELCNPTDLNGVPLNIGDKLVIAADTNVLFIGTYVKELGGKYCPHTTRRYEVGTQVECITWSGKTIKLNVYGSQSRLKV